MVAKWRDDPVYDQETYNAFLLLALSNERGGNRDEVKNDIRAIPEVLTVSTVESVDGGVQKQLADHFLSTLKLRVRLPRGADRDILTQQIAIDISKMRGVSVRRHTAEKAEELREMEKVQKAYKRGHARKKRRLIGKGKQRNTAPYTKKPSMKRAKSAPPGFGGLEELKITIRPGGGKLITSFEMQPTFNPQIWEQNRMRPQIRERLQEIAVEFIEKLDLPNADIKDIILTGSLANYNWSEYSDLDVHIVVDFREVAEDEGLVKKYFDAARSNWNRNHDIKVKGYEVELYVQDDDESHTSTGIYSILNDKWILLPSRQEFKIDKVNIFKKARHIMRDIDKVGKHLGHQDYDAALSLGQKIKNKIKKMRQGGLERGGIYSTENLAFKVLRRGGYMGKLLDAVGTAYDAEKSLAEQE